MSATGLLEYLYGGVHPGEGVELAFHEAGHALAAVLLGVGVRRAELFPADRTDIAGVVYLHGDDEDPCGPLRGAKGHLHDAAVTLAGPLAAAQRWGIMVRIGRNDRRQFDSSVAAYRRKAPKGFHNDTAEVAERIEALLREMLATEVAALDAVAVAVAKRGRLGGAEVESLVRDHRARPARDWRTALEMAMRTGGR